MITKIACFRSLPKLLNNSLHNWFFKSSSGKVNALMVLPRCSNECMVYQPNSCDNPVHTLHVLHENLDQERRTLKLIDREFSHDSSRVENYGERVRTKLEQARQIVSRDNQELNEIIDHAERLMGSLKLNRTSKKATEALEQLTRVTSALSTAVEAECKVMKYQKLVEIDLRIRQITQGHISEIKKQISSLARIHSWSRGK